MLLEEAAGFLGYFGGYNSAIVLAGSTALGVSAGLVGVFPLLRRSSLLSDAASHATLPGVVLGFLVASALGDGRHLPALMAGAAATAVLGIAAVHWIHTRTRLPEDAAIASVLGSSFGLGVVLLTHVQTLGTGNAAGLEGFLMGSAASMTANEALTIGGSALVVAAVTGIFLKEFAVLTFDETHAVLQGLNTARLNLAIMGLLVAVVVIGLNTVGLVLIVALVIIPASTARLWTARLGTLTALSGLFGGLSSWSGVWISIALPDVPAGPAIVLVAGTIFGASLLLAPSRGVIAWGLAHRRSRIRIGKIRLLLAIAEGSPPLDRRSRAAAVRWRFIDSAGRITPEGLAAARSLAEEPLQDLAAADHLGKASSSPLRGKDIEREHR